MDAFVKESPTIEAAFNGVIDRVISQCAPDEPSALFFLGLSREQARVLSSHPNAAPSVKGILAQDGTLGIDALANSKKAFNRDIFSLGGPTLFLYEQFIYQHGTVAENCEEQVYVVVNNLFDAREGYPSAVDIETLRKAQEELEKDATEKGTPLASRLYAEIIEHEGAFLTTPVRYEDEIPGCRVIDLLQPMESVPVVQGAREGAAAVAYPGESFLRLRLDAAEGDVHPKTIMVDSSHLSYEEDGSTFCRDGVIKTYASLCAVFGVSVRAISAVGGESEQEDASAQRRLLPTLRRYWGPNASFRKLKMYKDPSLSNEMIELSQGQIADYAVSQAELALDGADSFSNLFVTAPTGAGKSLLFQLPALYLAAERGALTIVIEPLKALMTDQVRGLRGRGVKGVAAINSDITYQERLRELARIKTGEVSILYLSPEMLVGMSLKQILGDRTLGLVVVDEVHTVTSWGKDFRPDYWYLGPYLSGLRRQGKRFPIFCLTATAVFGGRDDVVNQTIEDLDLGSPRLYLGNPRRDDISFDIRPHEKKNYPGPIEEVKTDLAVEEIRRMLCQDEHAIVYCPYRSQVKAVIERFGGKSAKVQGFHGGMRKEEKDYVTKAFNEGVCRVLVSTKAFGMGIDVDDISHIYHYAPTGNLADYIQEIGRGARKPSIRATSSIDFFFQDNRYARQLYSMSRLAQWQLREIMAKLYSVYASNERKSQNFLVSPDSFSYIFANENSEDARRNRVKSALMMISRDLIERYGFPVIIVRSKPTYTKSYLCLSDRWEDSFLRDYGSYLTKVRPKQVRYENRPGQAPTKVVDSGDIYVLDAAKMWEERFPDRTFPQFKRDLMDGKIGGGDGDPAVSSRIVLNIAYREDGERIQRTYFGYIDAIHETLTGLKHQDFTEKAFKDSLKSALARKGMTEPSNMKSLLTALVRPVETGWVEIPSASIKCLFRKTGDGGNVTYSVMGKHYVTFRDNAVSNYRRVCPKGDGRARRIFLAISSGGAWREAAELLEILHLATYEMRGGDDPELFIRLNDPAKVRDLSSNRGYSNRVLRRLNDAHDYSAKLVTQFFLHAMPDEERWDLVEEYFLGNDELVAFRLGIEGSGLEVDGSEPPQPKVRFRGIRALHVGPKIVVVQEGKRLVGYKYFHIWREARSSVSTSVELADLETLREVMKGSGYEMPRRGARLRVEGVDVDLVPYLIWAEARVALFDQAHIDDYGKAKAGDWKVYLLGQGESIKRLAQDVKLVRE